MSTRILNRDFQHPNDGWYQIEAKGNHPNKRAGVVQVIDDDACDQIVSAFNRAAAKPGFPGMLVDHEHFQHNDDQETRAFGWLMHLQNRSDGIYGQIRWTGTGQKAVDDGDYRFFSTEYDPADLQVLNDKKPRQVRPLALAGLTVTNANNNKGQKPITNRNNMETLEEQSEPLLNGGPGSGPRPGGGSADYQAKATNARNLSIAASDASSKAYRSGNLNDHHAALVAHQTAEQAHQSAAAAAKNDGDKTLQKVHLAIAADHADAKKKELSHFQVKNREQFPTAPGSTERHDNSESATMKTVLKALGLAEDASEAAALTAVTKVLNRNTELESATIDNDLELYKNRFDPKQRDFVKSLLVTNRAGTIEYLKSQPEIKAATAPNRVHNRNAAGAPEGNAGGEPVDHGALNKERDDEIADERARHPKWSFDEARNTVRNRRPELFGLPKRGQENQ